MQVAKRVEVALLRAQRRERAPLPHAQRWRADACQPLRRGAPRVSVSVGRRRAATKRVRQCAPVWRTRPVWPANAEVGASEACSGAGRSLRRASWPKSEPPCFRLGCAQVPLGLLIRLGEAARVHVGGAHDGGERWLLLEARPEERGRLFRRSDASSLALARAAAAHALAPHGGGRHPLEALQGDARARAMTDVVAAVTPRIDRLQRGTAHEEVACERCAWPAPARWRHNLGDAEVDTGRLNGAHEGLEVGKLVLARPEDWCAASPRVRRVLHRRAKPAQSPLQ